MHQIHLYLHPKIPHLISSSSLSLSSSSSSIFNNLTESAMDRNEEDMKFIGVFNQSFKLIFSPKKLFTQITLTLILPLTLLFLAHMDISNRIFWRIENSSFITSGSTVFINHRAISVIDWLLYALFKIVYFTLLVVFSLLSTAAIVFTIASVYINRDVTFRHIIKIVPKIWKKLFITFVFIYLALFVYNLIYGFTVFISRTIFRYSVLGSVVIIILLILYILGFLYLTVVYQLASVVTVLENVYGIKAMKKGKSLLYGKKKVGMPIAFVFYVFLVGLLMVYGLFVEEGKEFFDLAMIWRVMIGILICVLVMVLFLLFIVIQTVLYLVCKSFHREAIDKLSLSTFLGAYMEETVVYPKPGEEIQLGRVQAQTPAHEV